MKITKTATDAAPEANQDALVERALHWSELFGTWPDEHIRALAAIGRVERYERQAQVLAHDLLRREVLVVVSGCLEVNTFSGTGKKFVRALAGAGSVMGIVRLLAKTPSLFNYSAHEDTVLIHFPSDGLLKILDANPLLWRGVAMFMMVRHLESLASLHDLALGSLHQRTASTLVTLARMHGAESDGAVTLNLRLSQDDLAAMLGVSRQSMNKELRVLQDAGLIEADNYSRITISNLQALQGLV